MTKIHIDYETFCELDLRKVGAHRYAEAAQILCLAYAIGDHPAKGWSPFDNTPFPEELVNAAMMRGAEIHGWNAFGFERVITNASTFLAQNAFSPVAIQWHDTMLAAAYWGLPLSLGDAGEALNLSIKKDIAGHRLMLQMSRPRGRGLDERPTWWHQTDRAKLDRLIAYCVRDVEAERAISREIPPLPVAEREIALLDAQMMDAGLSVDQQFVDQLDQVTRLSLNDLNNEIGGLTANFITSLSQTGRLLKWVNAAYSPVEVQQMLGSQRHAYREVKSPVAIPSLDKASVKAALEDPHLSEGQRRILKLRQEAAKTSTAKIVALRDSVTADGTVKGLTQFYGASRSGRWAGRLIQVQNLPRPVIKNAPAAIADITEGRSDLDYLRTVHGRPLDVVSSCLRGCFVPARGRKFVVGDFSQIEARVIAWLAGQADILDVFARGEDPYLYTAAKNGSTDRQFGKVLVLACGFGMGASKFLETAKAYGVTLTPEQADEAVAGWRQANAHIAQFWSNLGKAFAVAIQNPNVIHLGPLTIGRGSRKLSDCVLIKLPSGRYLTYRNARMKLYPGDKWPSITYDGMSQTTKQWGEIRTYGGKLAENVTQAIARDCLAYSLPFLTGHSFYFAPLVTVHDEVICEVDEARAEDGAEILKACMSRAFAWAPGLPVAVDVKILSRYGK